MAYLWAFDSMGNWTSCFLDQVFPDSMPGLPQNQAVGFTLAADRLALGAGCGYTRGSSISVLELTVAIACSG